MGMGNAPIDYVLTESDRRELAMSFGVDLSKVPAQVTGGKVDEAVSGVTFIEMIRGHRIALHLGRRPALARAAALSIASRQRRVA